MNRFLRMSFSPKKKTMSRNYEILIIRRRKTEGLTSLASTALPGLRPEFFDHFLVDKIDTLCLVGVQNDGVNLGIILQGTRPICLHGVTKDVYGDISTNGTL